jgi:ribosomal protein S26
MLGRLGMDIGTCINSYLELASSIFQKKSTRIEGRLRGVYSARSRFESRALEEAVKKIVISRGLSADATLSLGEEPKCKMYETFLSPRYSVRDKYCSSCTISGLIGRI